MITHRQPRPLTATRLVTAAQLVAVLGDIPLLPGAACKGQPEVFDIEPDADPAVIQRARDVCTGCPALQACREWAASTPSQRRPSGVLAEELLPPPEPPPEPDTTTGTGRAVVFLTERLRNGPVPLAVLRAEAVSRGLSRGHLTQAANRLGVVRTRTHHRAFDWRLPA